MKTKILFLILSMAVILVSCSPIDDKGMAPGASITSEELASSIKITQQVEGNNNFTYITSDKVLPVQILDSNGNILAYGTQGSFQLLPGSIPTLTYRYINPDGSEVIAEASFTVDNYTDVPDIYEKVYGSDYGKTVWVWDDKAPNNIPWGKDGFMEGLAPTWWKFTYPSIDAAAVTYGLPKDGITDGWFSLDCKAGQVVETSRGETGTISINPTPLKDGWDMGVMTFKGTIPLLGIDLDNGNARLQTYYILVADGGSHLVLCAPEPGAGDWGSAWFLWFKRQGT